MWFIGVEVKQETSAPPPKKNPGSAPGFRILSWLMDPNWDISAVFSSTERSLEA